MRKTYASAAGGETGSIWIVSAPPAQRAADRAVLLVHPVGHRGEHLGRLVVARRQLDVVRLRDGPEVELVDFVGGDPQREAYQMVARLAGGGSIVTSSRPPHRTGPAR
jgi:hypothetical protein